MYAKHYGFHAPPFQLTPDTRFFFGSSGHSRAISHLVYGLSQQEGFIVITGEVGAGKTTLVEHLWSQLDHRTYVIARVVTTQVSSDDLLRLIATSFGLDAGGPDKSVLLHRLEHVFRDERALGRRCLLIVDEAQNLSLQAIEELRMLSNITIDGKAPLQTILLGQPQFRATLARADLDQLRQRVLAAYHLGPLSEPETRAYIEHRLRTVGWSGSDPAWEDEAFRRVYAHTDGVPRRINTLCSRVLLYAALDGASSITPDIVDLTAGELRQDLGAVKRAAHVNGIDSDGGIETLLPRLQALEAAVLRQERVFRRLLDLLGGYLEPNR